MAKILLIDDHEPLRRMARRALEELDHEVVEAADGSAALRIFAGLQPDLVVSDIYMPEMDGIELLIRIREAFPEARLVMISGGGHMDKESVLKASDALGAVATLPKPFTVEALQEAVSRSLASDDPAGEPGT